MVSWSHGFGQPMQTHNGWKVPPTPASVRPRRLKCDLVSPKRIFIWSCLHLRDLFDQCKTVLSEFPFFILKKIIYNIYIYILYNGLSMFSLCFGPVCWISISKWRKEWSGNLNELVLKRWIPGIDMAVTCQYGYEGQMTSSKKKVLDLREEVWTTGCGNSLVSLISSFLLKRWRCLVSESAGCLLSTTLAATNDVIPTPLLIFPSFIPKVSWSRLRLCFPEIYPIIETSCFRPVVALLKLNPDLQLQHDVT